MLTWGEGRERQGHLELGWGQRRGRRERLPWERVHSLLLSLKKSAGLDGPAYPRQVQYDMKKFNLLQ